MRIQTVESSENFEHYIRFLFWQLFGPVNHRQNWKRWERSGEKAGLSVISRSVMLPETSQKGLMLLMTSTYKA
jgi:hypothetical protein